MQRRSIQLESERIAVQNQWALKKKVATLFSFPQVEERE